MQTISTETERAILGCSLFHSLADFFLDISLAPFPLFLAIHILMWYALFYSIWTLHVFIVCVRTRVYVCACACVWMSMLYIEKIMMICIHVRIIYTHTQSKINTTELGCFIVWIFSLCFSTLLLLLLLLSLSLLRSIWFYWGAREKIIRYKDKYRSAYTTTHVHHT